MKTDARTYSEEPTPDDVITLSASLVCDVTGKHCHCMAVGAVGERDCVACSVAEYTWWLAESIADGSRTLEEADLERLDLLLLKAQCDYRDMSCQDRDMYDFPGPCDCETCRAYGRVDQWVVRNYGKPLWWGDVKALSEAIECLECGQLGPCMEAEHSEDADAEVPCTCLGCNAAARGKWISQELRSGRMSDAEVPLDAIYDLLVLSLCNTTGKSCTERVATDTCPACPCKTCRAFGNVDRWLYEGRGGMVRNERRTG